MVRKTYGLSVVIRRTTGTWPFATAGAFCWTVPNGYGADGVAPGPPPGAGFGWLVTASRRSGSFAEHAVNASAAATATAVTRFIPRPPSA
jgi:hypothetical protein